ncbi:IPT/TIG domain-containing protein, partial [Candidatus Solincola tengchongensis]|uniref:IPT/TIG domain-containing protein n=1 Tax=Candidatus Solincola tengchongensis TaxID=2900693 RepID=UPI00257B47E4
MDLTFNYDFNNLKLGDDTNYLLLNGHASLSFTAEFNVDIDVTWPSLDDLLGGDVLPEVDLKSVDFGVTVSEEVEIQGSASVTSDLDHEESVVEHEFAPIDVQIGPVPVVLVPYIEVHVGVDGSVSAGISFGAVQKGSVYAGASYDGTNWTPSTGKDFSFDWTPPTGSIDADVKVYAGPQFGIKLYGVCGPYINLEPYVRMELDTAKLPLWKVFVGVELDIGVKAGVELEFEADVGWLGTYEWSWSLELFDVKWDGALRWEMLLANSVHITSLSPESGPVGATVTVNGAGFGTSRENDSFVKFGDVRAEEYTSWSDNTIKCRVPAGVTGTVEVKVTHIFHKWGPVTIKVTSNGKPFTVTGGGGGGSAGGWQTQLSGVNSLYGVDALNSTAVWAVGAGGTILRYNGTSWTSQNSGTTNALYDVSAAAANRVWAVGYQGILLYYDGSSWKEQDSGQEGHHLYGVYAADSSHVWAVGELGSIVYWNGTYWTHQESGTTANLRSVEGTGTNNVWAVGDDGTILRYNGSTWSKVTGVTSDDLTDVWVKDAN